MMNKVKFLIPLGMLVALSACDGATKEQQDSSMSYTQSQLPEGCNLHFVGKVILEGEYYKSRIFYVKCNDTTTVSKSHEVRQGKNTHTETDVTVSNN